jgi:hypothetical protein
MAHEPERDVAAFLGGALEPEARAAFNEHLLGCDGCWTELHDAQEGRSAVESVRELAPAALRERLRSLVLAAEPAAPESSEAVLGASDSLPRARRRWVTYGAVTAVAAALVMVFALVVRPSPTPREPAALAAAVADFRAQALPGRQLPTASAPDLSALHLMPVGSGGGQYDGLPVDGYAYRDSAGRRLVVYLSPQPFPAAPGAQRLQGAEGPWTAWRGDVILLCARAPHALLVVGQDEQLVRSAASSLGVL